MSAMNYLIDSITEHYKNKPFSMEDVDILPFSGEKVPGPMLGQNHLEETKHKISKSLLGRNKQQATKIKMRKSAEKRSKTFVITYPNGVVTTISNTQEFCRYHNLNSSNFRRMLRGDRPTSQGFSGYYLKD